jgi:hypothetical protein
MKIQIFWSMHGWVNGSRRFEGTCRLHLIGFEVYENEMWGTTHQASQPNCLHLEGIQGGLDIQFYSFLSSALDGGERCSIMHTVFDSVGNACSMISVRHEAYLGRHL